MTSSYPDMNACQEERGLAFFISEEVGAVAVGTTTTTTTKADNYDKDIEDNDNKNNHDRDRDRDGEVAKNTTQSIIQ